MDDDISQLITVMDDYNLNNATAKAIVRSLCDIVTNETVTKNPVLLTADPSNYQTPSLFEVSSRNDGKFQKVEAVQ